MGKRLVNVKNFSQLSEKEAFALLQMASSRSGGIFESVRMKILELIGLGQNYGIVYAETASKEKLDNSECKKIVSSINNTFERNNVKHRIRYVPSKDGFLFMPEEKITAFLGKS